MQVQGVNPAVKGNIRLKSCIGVWTKQLSFSRGLILSRSSSVLWQPLGSLLLLCLLFCLQSILELPLSLLAGFCLTFTFIDKPTQNLNCVGLPLFGIVFTLCISCILANLFQILLGFNFDDWALDKEAKSTTGACDCCLWDPGGRISVMADLQPTHSSRDPSGQNYPAPVWDDVLWVLLGSAMLVYNGCLGLTCFLFAFKGRQLPDLYKNASLITVSMMLFMVIWIIFLPLYLTMSGKYKPAIEGAAILTSCFSILFSHLAPKCFIILFRKELNQESAITEYIWKHYERKGLPVIGTQHWFAKK